MDLIKRLKCWWYDVCYVHKREKIYSVYVPWRAGSIAMCPDCHNERSIKSWKLKACKDNKRKEAIKELTQ